MVEKNVPALEELTPLHRADVLFSTYLSSGGESTRNEEPGKVALMNKSIFE
jgi:hypothetical protein